MKINTPKKQISKVLIITPLAVLTIIGGIFAYTYVTKDSLFGWYPFGNTNDSTINYGPATGEEKDAGNASKDDSVEETPAETPDTTKPDNDQNTSDGQLGGTNVTLQITNKSFVNNDLHISSEILLVTASGTCTIVISKAGSASVTQSSEVQPLASTSTCKGFNIPLTQLSNGTWTITLTYSSDTHNGSTTDTVVVVNA